MLATNSHVVVNGVLEVFKIVSTEKRQQHNGKRRRARHKKKMLYLQSAALYIINYYNHSFNND